jgi:hypothetical protein
MRSWPNRFAVIAAAMCAAAAAAARPVPAEEADDAFLSLYGKEIKRVRATPDPADDLELAAQLVKASRARSVDRQVRALMCEQAYELTAKNPAGWPTAAAALEALSHLDRSRRAECREKLLVIRQQQYALSRGDERRKLAGELIDCLLAVAEDREEAGKLDDALGLCRQASHAAENLRSWKGALVDQVTKRLKWRVSTAAQVRLFKRRLKENEFDAETRLKLVNLLLVEQDDPAEAAKFVNADLDLSYRTYVPLAVRGRHWRMDEAEILALADWYRQLGADASRWGKIAVLDRARDYYRYFLRRHEEKDLQRTKAATDLAKVEAELDRLRRASPTSLSPGLVVREYAFSFARRMPDFGGLRPSSTQVVGKIHHGGGKYAEGKDAAPLRFHWPRVHRQYSTGAVFTGYVGIKAEGVYAFHVETEDGCSVSVAGTVLVSHSGTSERQERSGKVRLAVGMHPLRVEWFDRDGDRLLKLSYEGPGVEKQVVPEGVLFHTADGR